MIDPETRPIMITRVSPSSAIHQEISMTHNYNYAIKNNAMHVLPVDQQGNSGKILEDSNMLESSHNTNCVFGQLQYPCFVKNKSNI
mmetsp:Transcript_7546/g.11625  ORF Transcript_7546/g.11625 Transcript_7546/m.11625 type:complete len:86 (-) Transcript_7546:1534-1791(-)